MILNRKRTTSTLDVIGLITCLLIALGLRLFVILNQTSQLTIDRDAYLGIATSVADGRGYSSPDSTTPTAFRPPLYPLILAVGLYRFSPAFVVSSVNLLTGLLTVWLTASLGRKLQLGHLRFAAAILVAIDPLLLQYAAQPMTETLCTFMATLWLWSVTPETNTESKGLLSESSCPTILYSEFTHNLAMGMVNGITFGLLVLSRPTFWVIAGFCCLKWLIELRCKLRFDVTRNLSSFQSGIWSAIGTALTVSPWVLRNWLVLGIPILTTTHGGYTLLLGNNPVFYDEVVRQPWGTVWPAASQKGWVDDLESRMLTAIGPQATEIERDAWQSHRAKSYITTEPWHCVEAAFHRIRSLWNTVPQGEASEGVNRLAIVAVGWFYSIVLTAGLVGMVLVLKRNDRTNWFVLYVLIVSVQSVHLFYWTNTRMRAPLTPALALFATAVIPRRRIDYENQTQRDVNQAPAAFSD